MENMNRSMTSTAQLVSLRSIHMAILRKQSIRFLCLVSILEDMILT
ncbi:hypothetical protein PPTG_17888 [Phytophthora nicotianae INRA-310]|uniref:Uncharacterized protein n=1 Tax=Phytophthora nicotianae (strain INRA-310) TaxID=761204 RepID=W2PI39_PHYN3|nr:hypothetical protein PPTG_17888 [Phytophthora nicotianae INRA-310]ETN00688.1 hypothetical protein PPTG_17888 [Phytophthora nicotianae INRA-310]